MATKVQPQLARTAISQEVCKSIYQANVARVQSLCNWMAPTAREANDVAESVFVECFRVLASGIDEEEARNLLDREMVGQFRDRYFRPMSIGEANEMGEVDGMRRAIRSMAPMERLLFLLHDVYGYAVEKVADLTNLGETECRRTIFRGRMHARAALA